MTTTSDFQGATVHMRSGRARPIWLGHPWVAARSVRQIDGEPATGDLVRVADARGQTIDFGLYDDGSSIPVRTLGIGSEWPAGWPARQLPDTFWRDRAGAALAVRRTLGLPGADTDSFRLLNSEGDATPGFVVDVYGQLAVLHLTTAAAAAHGTAMARAIVETVDEVRAVYVQVDSRLGDLEPPDPVGDVPDELEIVESGVRYRLTPGELQKTGHYLDQRENRRRFGQLARGRRVLDAYCFAGSFALHAARGGAERVVGVDSSATAIEAARANAAANDLDGRIEWATDKIESWLREASERGEQFDLISLDPPKLAPNRKSLDRALRKMTALCKQTLRVLAPDGLILVASCSAAIGADELCESMADAASRVRRRAHVLEVTRQPGDHPHPAAMREGHYLTAVLMRVS